MTAGLPSGPQAAELFDEIVGGSGLRIERIVSAGQETPRGEWYDQESDEFVLLVSGAAGLRIDGETEDRVLRPGDWLILPAHCRHRVTWTQAAPPTIWLAVHYCASPTNSDGKE
ncbi:MAG: cupin domain-containing protein [Methyloceanibacter sp.]